MLSVMPSESTCSLDINLNESLRDLKMLQTNLTYDFAFFFCEKDISGAVNPLKVIEILEKDESYKFWYSKNPANEKIDNLTCIIKNSKMVVLGISTNFSKDEKCMKVYEMIKNSIRCKYLLVEFGASGDHKWLKSPKMAAVVSEIRVIMQNPSRIEFKMEEIIYNIESRISNVKENKNISLKSPDIFISYCWANSHDAIHKGTKRSETGLGWLDPRSLEKYFEENGISAWLDVEDISSENLFGEITKGLNLAKVMICCISDEYVEASNCTLEFRFAQISLRLPIIKVVVGTGNNWRTNELAFLSGK